MNRFAARATGRSRALRVATALAVALTMVASLLAWAVTAAPQATANELLNEDFRSATAPGWALLDDACLTDADSGSTECVRDVSPGLNDNGYGTPVAGNDSTGFLQLTSNKRDARGGALYNTSVSANNGLRIEFKQYQYGPVRPSDGALRRAADGISFFLVDGSVELTNVGAWGGALGYGRRVADNNPGINGGYLGIGLDAFGNYANTAHVGGADCTVEPADNNNMYWDVQGWNPTALPYTNAIGLRGPMGADTSSGYCLLTAEKLDTDGADGSSPTSWGTKSLWAGDLTETPSEAAVLSAARNVRIVITPNPNPTVSVDVDFTGSGTSFEPVISNYVLPTALPANFKFGFASSTGSATGSHLISDLKILGGPVAADDEVTLNQWANGAFNVSALVTPGALPLTATPYLLIDPADSVAKPSVTVAGVGTWTINTTSGAVTFVPVGPLTGVTPTIEFQATDTGGGSATGELSVIYRPVTGDESKTVSPGGTAVFAPSELDTVAGSGTITGYQLLDPVTSNPIVGTTYTDSVGGTWTINPATGATNYAADATYVGPVPSINYRVTDSNGLTDDGTLSITMGPVAGDEVKAGVRGSGVTFDPENDLVDTGSSTVITITLANPDTPGGNTQTVAGQGTWTLNPATGEITFAPLGGFTGNVTPITYRATDGNGLWDTGTLDVNYPPETGDASEIVQPGSTATFAAADLGTAPGSDPTLTYALLDPVSGNPIASNTYTDAYGGVWTIVPTTGVTTYAAHPDHRGPVPSINYRVTDGNSLSDDGTLSIIIPPLAGDDAKVGTPGTPVVFDPIGDLVDAGSSNTLTITLVNPDSPGGTTQTVAGEGTWTLTTTTGQITFTPDAGFTGPVTPIDYRVTDSNDQTDTGRLVVLYGPSTGDALEIVQPGDTATFEPADLATVPGSDSNLTYTLLAPGTGTPVLTYTDSVGGVWTIDAGTGETTYQAHPTYRGPVPTADYRVTDGLGRSADGELTILIPPAADNETKTSNPGLPVSFDPIADLTDDGSDPTLTISLVTPDSGSPNTKTVPGQGVWTLVPGTGVITFTPEAGFTGNPTPIDYRVTDGNSLTDTATLIVLYNQPPTAPDETVTVNPGQPATLNPVITPGTDPNVTVSLDGSDPGDPTTKTVPGQGVWTVVPGTGVATFTPEPGFTGAPTPITYTVTDGNGLTDQGTLTVLVNEPPVAKDQAKTTPPGTPVTFDPIADLITPGTSTDLTVTLIDPATGQPATGSSVTVPGEGVWTVDLVTGKITFTPEDGFSGEATIGYRVTDGNTLFDEATLTVTVTASADSGDDGDDTSGTDETDGTDDEETGDESGSGGEDRLPQTGANVTAITVGALGMLMLGAGLVVITRRRFQS